MIEREKGEKREEEREKSEKSGRGGTEGQRGGDKTEVKVSKKQINWVAVVVRANEFSKKYLQNH